MSNVKTSGRIYVGGIDFRTGTNDKKSLKTKVKRAVKYIVLVFDIIISIIQI